MEFTGSDYSDLLQWLRDNWDVKAEFSNGCVVWLKDDFGMIWGTDPYGQDWGCSYKVKWELSIRNWVTYWDADRTETGDLIVRN